MDSVKPKRRKRRPATTSEAREHQLITYAIDLAEEQLLNGTASAQVLTHYLKMASTREALEQERLKRENLLLAAKIDVMKSGQRMEEIYEAALKAMRSYAGQEPENDDGQDIF